MQYLNSDHKSTSSSSSKNKFYFLSNKWSSIEQNIDYIKSKRHDYLERVFWETETKINDFEQKAIDSFNVIEKLKNDFFYASFLKKNVTNRLNEIQEQFEKQTNDRKRSSLKSFNGLENIDLIFGKFLEEEREVLNYF